MTTPDPGKREPSPETYVDPSRLQDPARLKALINSGLLDTPPDEAFDRLTRLASTILGVPVSLVSLVDDDRQFFKSQVGLSEPWATARQTPLSHSICQHVVSRRAPLAIHDVRNEPFLAGNRATTELGVVAYAGVPLTSPDGETLGSFCAIDTRPRHWTADEMAILTELAASVTTEINLRAVARDAKQRAEAAERESNERVALLDSTTEGIVGIDLEGRCTFLNRAASRMLGWTAEDIHGLPMHETVHHSRPDGTPYPAAECSMIRVRGSGGIVRHETDVYWRKDGSSFPIEYSASPVLSQGRVNGAVVTFIDVSDRRRAERRNQIQHAVSVVLAEAATEAEALTQILTAVGQALEWKHGVMWLVDEHAGLLRCGATWRASSAYDGFLRVSRALVFAPGVGLPGRAWAERRPVWDDDLSQHPDLPRAGDARDAGLRGAVVFPVRGAGAVLGVAEFITDTMQPPDPLLLQGLITIGNQIGQYIERKRAEEDVRRSDALNSSILAGALDCVVTMAHDGTIREWNPAAERTFGYTRAEASGREMADLIIPPALREAHRHGLARYFETGEGPVIGTRIETVGMRRDGSEFPLELAVTRIALAEPPMFTGYLRDITERTLAARQMADQVKLSSLAAEVGLAISRSTTLDGMLSACADALVRWLDAAFARIWMLDADDQILELRASAGLYTHLDGPHSRIPIGEFKIGRIAQSRQPTLTNDVLADIPGIDAEWATQQGLVSFAGLPLVVEDRLVGVMAIFARQPLADPALRAMGSVANGIAVGIERKGALDALKIAKDAAESANVAKSRFLANMSHELRTPLNAVILYSELLQEEAQDRGVAEFIPDLEKIRRAGRHLLALINGVLDLAKVEAGRMELQLEVFDLRHEIDDVLVTVQPLLEQNHNRLDLHIGHTVNQMYADVTKVRQILLNLLSNATKFTSHGTVTLEIEQEGSEPDAVCVFRVRDTGIGMSTTQLERLFQPFSQADESVTRKYGGTGLGLSICAEFAGLMGGIITVDSETGVGTTFTVRLPAKVGPASAETPADAPLLVDGCALVIDDDPAARDQVIGALAQQGVASVAARDGEEGLRLARQFRPGIIFLDVIMPKMDGWTVLATLKADPLLRDVPVILLSIFPNQDIGYLLGADDFLVKPLDPERVGALLVKYHLLKGNGAALIVDDDEATRAVVRKLLVREGWEVEEAQDGGAALEQLANRRIALVLLDLIMPEMDGFEFLSVMRQQPAWLNIPVMVMTSKDLTRDDRSRLAGRVETIVKKGVHSHSQVLQEIRDIVRRHLVAPPVTGRPARDAEGD